MTALTPIQVVELAVSLSLVVTAGCAFLFWALRPGSRLRAWADEHDPGCASW